MRLANAVHTSRPWLIRDIASDFTLEDVWALPVRGDAEAFQRLLDEMAGFDPASSQSFPTRVLWGARDLIGKFFGLGRISEGADLDAQGDAGALPIPGTDELSLTGRLPDDLLHTADDIDFGSLPFRPLYRTDDEFAAELSNRTVHGVMHLAWAEQSPGHHQGQMAVYVKPRGALGEAYMALIKPFRLWIVYPALMRQLEREWNARTPR